MPEGAICPTCKRPLHEHEVTMDGPQMIVRCPLTVSEEEMGATRIVARQMMFEAFCAGFDESSEGFNGEYVGPRYRDPEAMRARLLEPFDAWLEGMAAKEQEQT